MRLFEITSTPLFIALNTKQNVGYTIERVGSHFPLGAALEGHLERKRPNDCLPRAHSFYLLTEPPEDGNYVYSVEPVGQIDRHHSGWLHLLKDAQQSSIGEMDHYSEGYWSKKEVPEHREALWESRSTKLKLLRWIGGRDDVRL